MRIDRTMDGLTGLEMIIAISALLIITCISASLITGGSGETEKAGGGLIVSAAGPESEILVTDGESEGIQDAGGTILDINLVCNNPEPSVMGSCLIPVRLLTGSTGIVDMSTAKVGFKYSGETEELAFSQNTSLVKPAWTIADRSHLIPLMQADGDIYLEPNEIFTLLIYPQNGVAAEDRFTVTISPKEAVPLSISLKVPPSIRSHRIVGLLPG